MTAFCGRGENTLYAIFLNILVEFYTQRSVTHLNYILHSL